MNTVPVTFSLPKHVHRRLLKQIPPRQRSHYVARAINSQLISDIYKGNPSDPWKEFLNLGKKLKLDVSVDKILAAKNIGRP